MAACVHEGHILLAKVRGPNLGLLMPLGVGKDEIFTSRMHSPKEPALPLQRHLPSLPQLPFFFFFFFAEKVFFCCGRGWLCFDSAGSTCSIFLLGKIS